MLKNDAIVKDTRRVNDLDPYEYKIGIWSGRDVRGRMSERTTWKMVMPKTTEIQHGGTLAAFQRNHKGPETNQPKDEEGKDDVLDVERW